MWRRSAYDNSREVEASEVKGLITEVGGSAPAGLITLLRAFVLFLVHGLSRVQKRRAAACRMQKVRRSKRD